MICKVVLCSHASRKLCPHSINILLPVHIGGELGTGCNQLISHPLASPRVQIWFHLSCHVKYREFPSSSQFEREGERLRADWPVVQKLLIVCMFYVTAWWDDSSRTAKEGFCMVSSECKDNEVFGNTGESLSQWVLNFSSVVAVGDSWICHVNAAFKCTTRVCFHLPCWYIFQSVQRLLTFAQRLKHFFFLISFVSADVQWRNPQRKIMRKDISFFCCLLDISVSPLKCLTHHAHDLPCPKHPWQTHKYHWKAALTKSNHNRLSLSAQPTTFCPGGCISGLDTSQRSLLPFLCLFVSPNLLTRTLPACKSPCTGEPCLAPNYKQSRLCLIRSNQSSSYPLPSSCFIPRVNIK